MKRIVVLGDAGRGKTTFASKLSKKLKIKLYSTDDYFWTKKYTVKRPREKAIKMLKKVYARPNWIIEGTTRSFLKPGMDKADKIIYLKHRFLLGQFYILSKREIKRIYNKEPTNIWEFIKLLHHAVKKKFKLGDQRDKLTWDELLRPYKKKVVKLKSFKDMKKFLEKIN
ncbi:hypothetical protein KY330_05205 [Candidatus Woesearchaeota archaeon]|nr:hypothetical protein [Candidatus Woesearchaeota archaeon]